MLAVNGSVDVTPKVNLMNPLHTGNETHNQGIQPDFETQGRTYQKSKTEALQKDLCPPFFKKKLIFFKFKGHFLLVQQSSERM